MRFVLGIEFHLEVLGLDICFLRRLKCVQVLGRSYFWVLGLICVQLDPRWSRYNLILSLRRPLVHLCRCIAELCCLLHLVIRSVLEIYFKIWVLRLNGWNWAKDRVCVISVMICGRRDLICFYLYRSFQWLHIVLACRRGFLLSLQ